LQVITPTISPSLTTPGMLGIIFTKMTDTKQEELISKLNAKKVNWHEVDTLMCQV